MSALPMRRIDAPRHRHTRDVRVGTERRRHHGQSARRERLRHLARRDGHPGVAAADLAAGPAATPTLRVAPRRRLAANFAAVVVVIVGVLMLFAVVLQTRMTERQGQIDRLERQVANEHDLFDVMRQHRAALRSPTRLSEESTRLAMVPATSTGFVNVNPYAMARVLAATGLVDRESNTFDLEHDPLEQVRRMRAAESGRELDAEEAATAPSDQGVVTP